MLIGGGFAGLAGGVELLSQTHRVSTGISQGFGYTAIIIAAITGMRPIGIFLVGTLFGSIGVGIGLSSFLNSAGSYWARLSHEASILALEL